METLLELQEVKKQNSNTCRTCKHRQKWQCGGSIIQYCGIQKSKKSVNGLKKIKVTNPACLSYEPENK